MCTFGLPRSLVGALCKVMCAKQAETVPFVMPTSHPLVVSSPPYPLVSFIEPIDGYPFCKCLTRYQKGICEASKKLVETYAG
jgi:hypothetical protein